MMVVRKVDTMVDPMAALMVVPMVALKVGWKVVPLVKQMAVLMVVHSVANLVEWRVAQKVGKMVEQKAIQKADYLAGLLAGSTVV